MTADRYCIIGAGPSGLLAARSFKHAGIPYDQYERNPDVGGIWDIDNEWSPMYESAHFISSKTVSHLPGYPMPEDYPDYPSHRQIFAYLRAFARDHGLYDAIALGTSVERIEREPSGWRVQRDDGRSSRYRGVILCSGNTWDPNMPSYPGTFTGQCLHSVEYRHAEIFAGKRVLVVGAGNSGCDIACDAAGVARAAFLSMRRGYHVIPKYVFGVPSDLFASRFDLPVWLEIPVFGAVVRMLAGDPKRYGLPAPDHRVLESHPIISSQLLHRLGHGDLAVRPDVARLDGRRVHFVDGSSEEIDVLVYATGYKVTYPFMDRSHFRWLGKYPDLYLRAIHREYDDLCCLGLHQTDGGAYEFFALQADMMANFILDQDHDPARAARFSRLKRDDRPDLTGGMKYVKSDRHTTYVRTATYRRHCERLFARMGWRRFGLDAAAGPRAGARAAGVHRPAAASK